MKKIWLPVVFSPILIAYLHMYFKPSVVTSLICWIIVLVPMIVTRVAPSRPKQWLPIGYAARVGFLVAMTVVTAHFVSLPFDRMLDPCTVISGEDTNNEGALWFSLFWFALIFDSDVAFEVMMNR